MQQLTSGFYWVQFAGRWQPAEYEENCNHWWIFGGGAPFATRDLQDVGDRIEQQPAQEPAAAQLSALRLQPGDILVARLADAAIVPQAGYFLRELLHNAGLSNQFVMLTSGQTLEAMGDEQLARLGLQRAGSWRDRAPLL